MELFMLAVQPDIKGAEDQMRFAVIAGLLLLVVLVLLVFYFIVRGAVSAGVKHAAKTAEPKPHGFPVATPARKRYDA